jgi:thiol-disulfide isomerase/thioredoxin
MTPGFRHAALIGAAAAVAAGGGWLTYRSIGSHPDQGSVKSAVIDPLEKQSASTPASASAASAASARRPGAIPEQMPDFSLATREGPPRRLSSFTNPALVVNFWATWCAPCRREIPLLKSLRSKRSASGVEVVGIAVDFREDVLQYARTMDISYPLLIGEQDGLDAANAFGMDMVFPFTVFSDAKRQVIALKVGELHENEADFILDRIAEVNAGQLPAEHAREMIAEQLRVFATERSQARTRATPGT